MKSTHRGRAFTLVELLVVIGIIAILVSILLPTLAKVREQGYRVKCLANLRSIAQAATAYAADNDQFLPYPNVGDPPASATGGTPAVGWLYQHPLSTVIADLQVKPGMKPPQTGVLWKYLANNTAAYRCPMDDDPNSISPRPQDQSAHTLTSYLMNGAACGYAETNYPAFRLPRFKKTDVILFAEIRSELRPNEAGLPAGLWKDGAFTPDDGITRRHRGGGCVVTLSGAAEWWTVDDFDKEANLQVGGNNVANRLWCNPAKPDGRP